MGKGVMMANAGAREARATRQAELLDALERTLATAHGVKVLEWILELCGAGAPLPVEDAAAIARHNLASLIIARIGEANAHAAGNILMDIYHIPHAGEGAKSGERKDHNRE